MGIIYLLQSAIKDPRTEIEKYFDPEDNQNLRNRFADTNDESGVIVEFIAPSGGTIKELKRNTDGSYSINTFQDAFVNRVLVGSDFINYKFLSKFTTSVTVSISIYLKCLKGIY